MSAEPALYPCPTKGCPWRGPNPDVCPMHGAEDAWERQPALIPEHIVSGRLTRHR